MLKEYKDYIESIRDNLIQNNIQLSVCSLDKYEDLFYYTLDLEQIVWYYRILAINGYSIDSPFISKELYIEKIRQIAYKDFTLSLEEFRNLCKNLMNKVNGTECNLVEDEEEDDRDDEEELNLFDSEDTSSIESSTEEKGTMPKTFLDFIQIDSVSIPDVVQLNKTIVHGLFIDEWLPNDSVIVEEPKQEVSNSNLDNIIHGLFIDEWLPKDTVVVKKLESDGTTNVQNENDSVNTNIIHGVFIDEWEKKEEGDNIVHGLFIDEWSEGKPKGIIHGLFIDEWEKSKNIVKSDEEIHGLFIDEWEKVVKPSKIVINKKEVHVGSDTSPRNVDVNGSIKKSRDRDLSDNLQDITNRILTGGKRMFTNRIK